MPKHIPHPFSRFGAVCDDDPPGRSVAEPDFEWAKTLVETTCHKCLDGLVRMGDTAVQRIVILDTLVEVKQVAETIVDRGVCLAWDEW